MAITRVIITEEMFKELIRGKVANDGRDVEIILQDIGWMRMVRLIEEAQIENLPRT